MSGKRKQVWLVTTGPYSDYRVVCACPTEADAEAIVAKYGEGDIEEFDLYTGDVEPVPSLRLEAWVMDDGTVDEHEPEVTPLWPFDYHAWGDSLAPVAWNWSRYRSDVAGGFLVVRGTDHERVRRVYSDRKAMLVTDPAMRAKTKASGRK